MSARPSTRSPRICSGAMKSIVPTQPPGAVTPALGERMARETEVAEVDLIVPAEQDVRGLDVAVDDPGVVRGVERLGDLEHDRRGLRRCKRPGGGHALVQVVAVDEAHGDVGPPVVLAVVMDRDDVRVLDRRRGARFVQEALADARIAEPARRDDLQGHGPVEAELGGLVDDAHPPATGDRFHAVPGELRDWRVRTCDLPSERLRAPTRLLQRAAPLQVARLQLLYGLGVRPTAPPRGDGGAA